MADITKCKDITCPAKDKCRRFTAPDSLMQSYFLNSPKQIKDGVITCEMFWGEKSESIMNQLIDIVNNNKDEYNT